MRSRKGKQPYFQHNLLQVSEVYIKRFSATSYKYFSFKKTNKINSSLHHAWVIFLLHLFSSFSSSTINAEKPLFEKNMKTCYRNTLVKEGVVISMSWEEGLAQCRVH